MNTLLRSESDKPNFKEPRLPFWMLVNMLDNGTTEEQILKQYPSLSAAEIKAAIKYADSTTVLAD